MTTAPPPPATGRKRAGSWEDEDVDQAELQALQEREAKRKQERQIKQEEPSGPANKPVFLTREQREALAKEEEEEKEEIAQLMDEAEKEQRHVYMQKVRDSIREARTSSTGSREREREAPKSKEEVDKEKEIEEIRNSLPARGTSSRPRPGVATAPTVCRPIVSSAPVVRSYLGVKKKKKKVLKISEKFRFSFDWHADEDTSVDLNPIYEKKQGGSSTGPALLWLPSGLRPLLRSPDCGHGGRSGQSAGQSAGRTLITSPQLITGTVLS
jgi:ATP-dependent RNA helicase DDX23/PRP28